MLCGLVGAITNSPKKFDSGAVAVQSQNSNVARTIPTPSPAKTFVELKSDAERLLKTSQSDYENIELEEFDSVMKPLKEIPTNSKDYKAAQALHKKLIDKVAVIGAERIVLGPKPMQSGWDAEVLPVKQYLRAVLNDYDSSEFVEWSPVTKVYIGKEPYWGVRLRLRAKNGFGALILRDTYYYIRNNQVVKSTGLGAD